MEHPLKLFKFYFVMEPRAAIKFLGRATDGSDSDVRIFERFLFQHGTTTAFVAGDIR